MSWIPLVGWLTAVAVALVVFGFCAYELTWKARRLRTDLQRLKSLHSQLLSLQADVAATQARAGQH